MSELSEHHRLGLHRVPHSACAWCDDVEARTAAEQRAAAVQAENVALRAALERLAERRLSDVSFCWCRFIGSQDAALVAMLLERGGHSPQCVVARAALATPHDASALRALMLKAAGVAGRDGCETTDALGAVVDEILRGGR